MNLRPVDPPSDLSGLEELFDVVAVCDGHAPIGEHKYLDLLHSEPDRVAGLVSEVEGRLVAYLALAPTQEHGTWAMELAVHPLHRSKEVLDELISGGLERIRGLGGKRVRVWAFQPNITEVLEESGFVPERELRQLRIRLPHPDEPRFPERVEVRAFRPGIDEERWLAVNNAAFAGHPENGAWTREILADREAQPWFDAEGFRMAWEGSDLVGFCWTKVHPATRGAAHRHPIGEIYVIAVAPPAQGRGLGRNLVLEGLRYLWEVKGVSWAMLYVDAGNRRGLDLYDRLGFRLDHVDRSFVKELSP